ncbi:MAG: hypothetical protein A2Y67_01425 [Candidatus Buchananbacteria bacterium RBG_13_39_9]|uniref:Uncharacterized protein n=1 Tax=Candidatus Buchananbacteria bacterium RBG_13_39_9 TaxID=1797531 RepID=A0A1G1XRJ8_9BACT|nr:MAG: hypothetical protein A2Y67_01425 [Candidatus Buchananbacteria bacterium RBG_13_39_9]
MKFEADVKRKKLWKLIIRLSKINSLEYFEGKKHTKITCIHNGRITMLPRHKIIIKYTANEILGQLKDMGFTDEDIENNYK